MILNLLAAMPGQTYQDQSNCSKMSSLIMTALSVFSLSASFGHIYRYFYHFTVMFFFFFSKQEDEVGNYVNQEVELFSPLDLLSVARQIALGMVSWDNYLDVLRKYRNHMSSVKRICVFEHSVMTHFSCACPAIQSGQGSGFLSEGSS